jgi:pimeloyl-ACP methyl ester carboxylesterase
VTHYRAAIIDGHKVFYREAGDPEAPSLLLLHGFPTSSHMFRGLIPLVADRYHVVAPDLLGFSFSDAPGWTQFKYTFDNLTKIVDGFTEAVGVDCRRSVKRGDHRYRNVDQIQQNLLTLAVNFVVSAR